MSNGAAGNYVNYQILTKIKIDNIFISKTKILIFYLITSNI
jgi:hypothetical protein